MVEIRDLEYKVLFFLAEHDDYNRGIGESEFLAGFAKEYPDVMALLGNKVDYPRNVLVSHLNLMVQRGLIDYGSTATETGRFVGPIRPAGYDMLEKIGYNVV